MLMRPLVRRLRAAQDVIVAKDARIHDLESKLEAAEAAVVKLMRSGAGGADDRIRFLTTELDKRARLIDQLRAGVVDDAQTAALRYDRDQARAAARALESRLADLQAANSGIRRVRAL
ncbi:hypothetical protein [Streptomyces sp. NPDC101132]|uniref:hypothetical protein n=1 Tax=Streptomyces sp. NPDC101132 TaxID=3366110 RepID=UPI00382B7290